MPFACEQEGLKEGRVEINIKKTKWAQRVLSLNESWLVCREVTAATAEDLNDGVVRTYAETSPSHSVCDADSTCVCVCCVRARVCLLTVQGEAKTDESILLKEIVDCQLTDMKGKLWGTCFQVTEKHEGRAAR